MASRIFCETVASISEFKKNPTKTALSGNGLPVAVLNRNKPEFYCVPAPLMQAMLSILPPEVQKELFPQGLTNCPAVQ